MAEQAGASDATKLIRTSLIVVGVIIFGVILYAIFGKTTTTTQTIGGSTSENSKGILSSITNGLLGIFA